MCGIFGVVPASRRVDVQALARASASLEHRGPDGFGYLLKGPEGTQSVYGSTSIPHGAYHLALAIRRLAIIDLETGDQPLSNEDESVWCVYNGEIYNYVSLREQLIERGHRFGTQSDTEVLCHGYEEWGTGLVDHLEGIFAFCIYDSNENVIVLCRDRLGVKPLYYSLRNNQFCFASEVKAILEYDPGIRISRDNIFDFFLFDQVPPPGTAYESISKLDAGEFLVLDCEDNRILRKTKYWDIAFKIESRSAMEVVEGVEHTLRTVVKKQAVADVKVGTFLSGGIDSSLVTRSLMDRGKVRTFHLYSNDRMSELRWATNSAFTGVDRNDVLYEPDLEDCLEALSGLDVPLYDGSFLPTYLISREASRNGMKVILSGDGGDENFAGYDTIFYPAYLFEKFRSIGIGVWGNIMPLYGLFARLTGLGPRYSEGMGRYIRNGSVIPSYAQVTINNLLSTRKVAENTVVDFRVANSEGFSCVGDKYPRLNQMLYLHYRFYLSLILEKVDFASMANSLEVRVPLLDNEMVDLALTIPFEYKIRARGKYPLKAIAEQIFGGEFAYRRKRGFTFDFDRLFVRADVESRLLENLRIDGVQDFLDVSSVEKLIEVNKRSLYQGKKLWRALMFTEWYRNWGARHA